MVEIEYNNMTPKNVFIPPNKSHISWDGPISDLDVTRFQQNRSHVNYGKCYDRGSLRRSPSDSDRNPSELIGIRRNSAESSIPSDSDRNFQTPSDSDRTFQTLIGIPLDSDGIPNKVSDFFFLYIGVLDTLQTPCQNHTTPTDSVGILRFRSEFRRSPLFTPTDSDRNSDRNSDGLRRTFVNFVGIIIILSEFCEYCRSLKHFVGFNNYKILLESYGQNFDGIRRNSDDSSTHTKYSTHITKYFL